MREILTQEEVDALLEAFDSGDIDDSQQDDSPSTPFDFLTKKPIEGIQETLLELIQDRTAKGSSAWLTGVIRREIKVSAASNYIESAGSFLSNFKGPSIIGLLSAEGTPAYPYLAMSPFLAYGLIDLTLGGDGRIAEPDGREFSVLEVRMIRKTLEGVTNEFSKAWASSAPGRFGFVRVETNPKMLPSVQEQDQLFVMNFRVESETGLSRDFTLAIPFLLIEPLKAQQTEPEADPKMSEYTALMREAIEEITVGIEVMLGEANLPIREILSLKPGDVITTEQEIDAPIAIMVEGIPKLYGRAGLSRGNRAIKIIAG